MAIIGSFSYGSASAIQYSTVEELLSQLVDNNQNIIVAQDVRDAIYTLWERTDPNNNIVYFQNQNPTTIDVGGIPKGTDFTSPTDMQTMWNDLLYPYIPPSSEITPNYNREFGDPNGLSVDSITFNWSVVKNSKTITSIIINGQSITPTGDSQSGTVDVTGTHSWSQPTVSEVNNFLISVSDVDQTIINFSTITWMNRIYWGKIDIGDINLTLDPSQITLVASLCDDQTILNLDGAGVGYGSELSTTKTKNYNGINGNGEHLIFAWPTSFSGDPIFIVNGLQNTAFTKVRTSSLFTNQYDYTTYYDVWISNTLQNSAISLFDII